MNEPDVMARLAAANPVRQSEMDDAARSSRAPFLLRSVLARPRARRR